MWRALHSCAAIDANSPDWRVPADAHHVSDWRPDLHGRRCAAVSPCGSTGGVVAVSVPIDVRAERTGHEIAIHPAEPSATFRMNLRVSGIALFGTASGQVRSGGVVVATDGGRPQSAAVVTGIAASGPRVAAGTLGASSRLTR